MTSPDEPVSSAAAPDATRDPRAELPGRAAQVFAVVGGMAAWGVALLTAYPIVQVACVVGQPLLVHLVRWVALAVALAATATGYRIYHRARRIEAGEPTDERLQRVRFVGFGGLLLSASGVLLLFVEDLATWVIDPCL